MCPTPPLIVVENAEVLRPQPAPPAPGPVGRGKHQSYCVIITNTRSPDSLARLRTLASTTDGFRIAEEDLKLQGPGDFFGSRQHGLPQLALADLSGISACSRRPRPPPAACSKATRGSPVRRTALCWSGCAGCSPTPPDIFN